MARTPTPTTKQEEAHIVVDVPYGAHMAFPARLASEILPFIKFMSKEYVVGSYVYKVVNKDPEVKLLSAEKMAVAVVTAALAE